MPVISFDYFIYPLIINKKLSAIYYPVIRLQLSNNRRIYSKAIDCILDSGADFNLFPASIGEELGINLERGEKIIHTGIGNAQLEAYKHSVILYIKGYKFKTDVNFSYEHKVPILGRNGFFDNFKKVIFNEEKLRIELHGYQKK